MNDIDPQVKLFMGTLITDTMGKIESNLQEFTNTINQSELKYPMRYFAIRGLLKMLKENIDDFEKELIEDHKETLKEDIK